MHAYHIMHECELVKPEINRVINEYARVNNDDCFAQSTRHEQITECLNIENTRETKKHMHVRFAVAKAWKKTLKKIEKTFTEQ